MKLAVVQVVSGAPENSPTNCFWDLKKVVRSEDHDLHVFQVDLATWEKDIRALAQQDLPIFVVSGSDIPTIHTATMDITRLLQSLEKKVLGPPTDVANTNMHYSPVREHNDGSTYGEQMLHILVTGMDANVIYFGPALSSPGGPVELVTDKRLKSAALATLRKKLDHDIVKGTCNLLRVDLQFTTDALVPCLAHIEFNPRVFASEDSTPDDELVKLLVPGGPPALLDLLISNRLASYRDLELGQKIVDTYATCASTYDEEVTKFPYYDKLQGLVSAFDWSGNVLDLGCGTGLLGALIHQKGEMFQITGVDLSPDMVAARAITAHYETPVKVEPVQIAMMRPDTYDHVACFGTVMYLNAVDFTAFLSRVFMIAQKSISFDIEDVSKEYLVKASKNDSILPSYNHTEAFRRFQIPPNWRIVHDEYGMLYHDHHETDSDVFDTMIRIEKLST